MWFLKGGSHLGVVPLPRRQYMGTVHFGVIIRTRGHYWNVMDEETEMLKVL